MYLIEKKLAFYRAFYGVDLEYFCNYLIINVLYKLC